MPIEHDDEATSFDLRPWGAQQRVLPRGNFAAAVRVIPPLPIPVAARAITPLGSPIVRPPLQPVQPVQPPYMPAISFAPLEMPALTVAIDSALRVHRQPLTLRSFIAVPIGALVAILAIALGYRASTIRSPGAAAAAAAPALPVLAPIARVTPPPIEGVATFDAPVALERTIPTDATVAKSTRVASSRKQRPRKIIAVDSATPLGNLRPRRY